MSGQNCAAVGVFSMTSILITMKASKGKERQGTIVSMQGLVEALAAGIGAQLLGIILQLGGFDGKAAVQTQEALAWVENSVTVIPAGFLALYKYPITKKKFEEIQRKLQEKKDE